MLRRSDAETDDGGQMIFSDCETASPPLRPRQRPRAISYSDLDLGPPAAGEAYQYGNDTAGRAPSFFAPFSSTAGVAPTVTDVVAEASEAAGGGLALSALGIVPNLGSALNVDALQSAIAMSGAPAAKRRARRKNEGGACHEDAGRDSGNAGPTKKRRGGAAGGGARQKH